MGTLSNCSYPYITGVCRVFVGVYDGYTSSHMLIRVFGVGFFKILSYMYILSTCIDV